jgi:integrase
MRGVPFRPYGCDLSLGDRRTWRATTGPASSRSARPTVRYGGVRPAAGRGASARRAAARDDAPSRKRKWARLPATCGESPQHPWPPRRRTPRSFTLCVLVPRALQQFFKWFAAEEEIPDPMAGLRPPHVPDKLVPVFAADDLARLERACAGRSFQQRRDAAVIAVLRATGMRLSELAGIRYNPDDPRRSDLDLWA